jgi:glyoxylase-like metal-dependent hydrolase (beta-lactamase superfamily II)
VSPAPLRVLGPVDLSIASRAAATGNATLGPMGRLRLLFGLVLSLAVLLLVVVVFLRVARHHFEAPEPVRASVLRVHGTVADFFVARAGTRVLLFDAGVDPEGRGLDAALTVMHAGRQDVSDIFITHGHADHVAAATLCPHARLHGGAGDREVMSGQRPPEPTVGRLFRRLLPVAPVRLTDAITEHVEIPVGDGPRVLAIPFPGHTPGSMAYLYEGVLFVGDSMNYETDRLTFAFALFSVDIAENRRRIATLPTALALDDVQVVCTAHGGCTREADTRRLLDDVIARASR